MLKGDLNMAMRGFFSKDKSEEEKKAAVLEALIKEIETQMMAVELLRLKLAELDLTLGLEVSVATIGFCAVTGFTLIPAVISSVGYLLALPHYRAELQKNYQSELT